VVGLQIRSEQRRQCAAQLASGFADPEVRSPLRRVHAEFRARADELADIRAAEACRAAHQQPTDVVARRAITYSAGLDRRRARHGAAAAPVRLPAQVGCMPSLHS